MKTWRAILSIVATLAAIAGIVYIAAKYGDKIVAWAKELMNKFCCCKKVPFNVDVEAETEEADVEELAAEDGVQAEETDFEG